FPLSNIQALTRLQDYDKPFSVDEVEKVVCSALGARITNVFSTFDREPLASASLGQVHRATLHDGRVVAVKVQRPGIRQQIVEDMEALEEIAELLDHRTEWGKKFGFA